jgi:hypothetical protein
MAVLAFAVAGAAIGGAVGGTFLGMTAVSVGWMAGSMVGSLLFPGSLPDRAGPRLKDISPQASEYGRPISLIYGRAGIGGNVIWASELVEVETTTEYGGKGGPSGTSTEYAYFGNFAVAVCEGPCIVTRIWAGPEKRLIWDGDATEGGTVRPYMGTDTQLPDPLIESYLGVGNVPAYRGTCYVVFEGFPLANDGNRIPFLTIEVSASGGSSLQAVVTDLSRRAGVESHEIDVSRLTGAVDGYVIPAQTSVRAAIDALRPAYYFDAVESPSNRRAGTSRVAIHRSGGVIGFINTDTNAFEQNVVAPEFGNTGSSIALDTRRNRLFWCNRFRPDIAYVINAETLGITEVTFNGGVPIYTSANLGSLIYHPLLDKFIGLTGSYVSSNDGTAVVMINAETFTVEAIGETYPTPIVETLVYAPGYTDRVYGGGLQNGLATIVYLPPLDRPRSALGGGGRYTAVDPITGFLWVVRPDYPAPEESTLVVYDPETRALVAEIPLALVEASGITYVASARVFFIGNNTPGMGAYEGVIVSATSLSIVSYLDNSNAPLAWFGTVGYSSAADRVYMPLSNGAVSGVAALTPSGGFLGFISGGSAANLASTVIDMPAPLEQASVIKYVPRGGPLQVVVPDADLAARDEGGDAEDALLSTRQMDAELPASVAVTYMLANTEYAPATQMARRLVGASGGEVVFDMPLVLTDEKAKQIASVHLTTAWAQRIGYAFSLPRKYAYLEPTDLLVVRGRTMRLTKITASPSGVLQCEAFADDAQSYNPSVQVAETPDSGKVVAVQVPSRLELM